MKKNIFPVLFLLFAMILSACGSSSTAVSSDATQAPSDSSTQAPRPTTDPSAPFIKIVRADGTTFDVTVDAVKALPLAQVTVEGKLQEGPKLMDVLALAGVTDFTEVTLSGSSAPATLTRAQVDDNTILDFNNHGTTKLATTYIQMSKWTKDVNVITLK